MRIVIPVLSGLVALIGVLALVIATRPAEFEIQRSATFAAPRDVAFALVNDFHRWEGWNPWGKMDPAMKVSYEGASSGVGAKYAWQSDQVGQGRMTITESRPAEKIAVDLEFLRPFAARNVATFTFAPDGPGTKVTWSMAGRNGFMAKAMGLVMNMDQMIGKQFEDGLASMKALAEAQAQEQAASR